ncbi:pyridoxamine 5'-phosphate oxidase family protein [Nocardioides sp. R-C-SC26]|uniref:pyridoxamine 5'-phosphate oxidase family protein n=1 Tax=Nocardioides sp. R-C-SC26 TaxID=2870414 RepID=UPI001E506669|nr:PPOX class F420-dependent oxidoreductase [Nocardioides sp. R-C-SC26]
MANQRGQIVMSDAEVDAFLTEQRSSTCASTGPSGQIHLVAMWYAWHDGHIWLETKGKSQKVQNLRRDPRMSVLVEAGHTYDELRGVSLEGTAAIVEDPDVVWDVCVRIFERYNAPYTEELRPIVEIMAKNRVVVRLDVERVRSWDHRKLGLDPIPLGGTTAPSVGG